MNDIADKLAQKCRKSSKPNPPWPQLQNQDGIILYDELPIMDNKNITTSYITDQLFGYYSNKWNIPQKFLYIIDWNAYNIAMKRMTTNESIKISKIGSYWIPHNHKLSKIDKKKYLFPIFQNHDESTSHMIECTLKNNPEILHTYEK